MAKAVTIPSERTRNLPSRDAWGRFVARPGAASKAPRMLPLSSRDGRVRALPARDARGRFIAFPTMSAPNWYVLCVDGCRVRGEEVVRMQGDVQQAPPPQLPRGLVMRQRRPWVQRSELVNWLLMGLFLVVVGCYGLSLPVPHH